jgi:hypothetical protein
MQLALPQIDTRSTYQRLATLYTIVFAASALSFYVTLLQTGYDVSLGLFAATAAGLHYALLRLAGAMPAQAAPVLERRYKPAAVLSHSDLFARIEQLRQEARGSRDELGLMLISLAAGKNDTSEPPPEVMKLVRGELFRAADSRIFQIDEHTLAIAENQLDVVLHFDKIALALHRQLLAAQRTRPGDAVRATVGVAVATGGRGTSAELMENARAAIRLAEANGRDTFFRRVA